METRLPISRSSDKTISGRLRARCADVTAEPKTTGRDPEHHDRQNHLAGGGGRNIQIMAASGVTRSWRSAPKKVLADWSRRS
jgi:hypothetical protein